MNHFAHQNASNRGPRSKSNSDRSRSLRQRRLRLEALESRALLAIITVTTLDDDTLVNSAGDSAISLREAIQAANTDTSVDGSPAGSGADRIEFDPALLIGGVAAVNLKEVGDTTFGPSALMISSQIDIVGPGGESGITISRDGTVSKLRLFYVSSSGIVTFENLTLSNGRAVGGKGGGLGGMNDEGGGGGAAGLGGAIFNEGTLHIRQSTLSGNLALGGDGGIGGTGYGAPGGGGGGLNGDGGVPTGGAGGGATAATTGSAAIPAGFGGGGGGGTYVVYGYTNQRLGTPGGFGGGGGGGSGIPFTQPSGGAGGFGGGAGGNGGGGFAGSGGGGGAGLGGAVFNHGGSLTIINSTLSANTAQGGAGGAELSQGNAGHGGSGYGGAVFNYRGALALLNSTLASNVVTAGAGGASSGGSSGSPGNRGGGAVYTLADGAGGGGGMGGGGIGGGGIGGGGVLNIVAITNSILANSPTGVTDFVSDAINGGTPALGGSNNIIESNLGFPVPGIYSSADPLLAALDFNGGPTRTHLPNSLSEAIDHGDPLAANSLTNDQRGYTPRAVNTVDIGAVEVGATAAPAELSYANANATLGSQSTIAPSSTPPAATRMTAVASPGFKGSLTVDPATGNVYVANAYPAGSYTVTVRAFDGSGPVDDASFTLTVTQGAPVTTMFATPTNYGTTGGESAGGDFNRDGKLDVASVRDFTEGAAVTVRLGNGNGTFGTALNTAAGAGNDRAQGIATADFNGDGKLDVVTANFWDLNLSIALGDGAGGFTVSSVPGTGAERPISVATGDFNHDGKLDLVFCERSSFIYVRLGNGDGTFGSTLPFGSISGIDYGTVAVGDVNGDGDLDVLHAGNESIGGAPGQVGVALGNGVGNFALASTITVASTGGSNGGSQVVAADFNADGLDDVAVADATGGMAVALASGAGFFGPATLIPGTGSDSSHAVAGDLDRDGDLDLVQLNWGAGYRILSNSGSGSFTAGDYVYVPGNRSVDLGDYNGDGRLDLLVMGNTSSQVILQTMPVDFGDAPAPYPVTIAESGAIHGASGPTLGTLRTSETNGTHSANADADGPSDDGVTFPATMRSGQLGVQITVNVGNLPSGTAKLDGWIDFNADGSWGGVFDHIINNKTVTPGVNTFTFNVPAAAAATTTFARFRLSTAGQTGPRGTAADGEVEDYAVTISPTRAATAQFVDSGQSLGTSTTLNITVGDIDGDGDLDVVTGVYATGAQSEIWVNQGGAQAGAAGFFARQTFAGGGLSQFTLGDLDRDGDLDLVEAGTNTDNRVWINQGGLQGGTQGSFVNSGQNLQDANTQTSYDVALGDVDGDGDLDAVFGNGSPQQNSVWANNGAGVFTELSRFGGPSRNVREVRLADLDRDGDLDAYEGNNGGGIGARVYLNDGAGTFIDTGQQLQSGQGVLGVALGDLDGDGDLDSFTGAYGFPVQHWRNNGTGGFSLFQSFDVGGGHRHRGQDLADLDGDGDLDGVVVRGGSLPETKEVWLNNGTGTFSSSGQTFANRNGQQVALADFNGDGAIDMFAVNVGAKEVFFNTPVPNSPPTANADGPYTVAEGGMVQLTGTGTDTDGTIALVEWDLDGDGTFGEVGAGVAQRGNETGTTPTYNAANLDGPTQRLVTVRVTDDDGASATAAAVVTVMNVAPTANAGGPYTVAGGSSVTLSGTGGGPVDSVTLSWDLDGDNTFGETGNAAERGNETGTNPTFNAASLTGPSSTVVTLRAMESDVLSDFNAPVAGTIKDKNGIGTGFTHRLPGTGSSLPANDPNMDLSQSPGSLVLTSTHANINQVPGPTGTNLDQLEAPGYFLPNIGTQDFSISARFSNVRVPNGSDQLELYVGTSATNVVRTGFHQQNVYIVSENRGSGDVNTLLSPLNAFSSGDDIILTFGRAAGVWTLAWQNLTNPTASGSSTGITFPWLDSQADLYVGVLASNAGTTTTFDARIDDIMLNLTATATATINIIIPPPSDFGDAPAPYPVTISENGAIHGATGPTLGADRDADAGGTHSANASADGPDDDGVTLPATMRAGQLGVEITVNVGNLPSGTAKLDGWIDFNADGSWGGVFDHIINNATVHAGSNTFLFNVPAAAAATTTFARFRLSTAGQAGPRGTAADGEVEDYAVTISPTLTATAQFTSNGQNFSGINSQNATIGDIDGDGDLDLVVGVYGAPGQVWVNQGGAQAGTPGQFTTSTIASGTISSFALGDVDRDGDLDLIEAGADTHNRVWLNQGGTFVNSGQNLGSNRSYDVAPADIDGDGDLDLVFGGGDYLHQNTVWANNGAGVFSELSRFGGAQRNTREIRVADLDRDGDLDVIEGNNGGGFGMRVYLNDGAGTFTELEPPLGFGQGTLGVALGDLDGDGDIDLFASSYFYPVQFWQNNGAAAFGQNDFDTGGGHRHRGADIADLDGDGDLDGVVVRGNSVSADDKEVWLNNGLGGFTITGQSFAGQPGQQVFLADFNGDGAIDMFAANYGTPEVLFNTPMVATPPTANAGGPYTVAEGGSVTLAGSGGSAGATFQWDLDGDGSFGEVGGLAQRGNETGATPTYNASGLNGPDTKSVTLRVTNTDSSSTTSTATINITNAPPTASAGGPYTVNEGSSITFTGTASDPGGDSLTFRWDFDYDGTTFTPDTSSSSSPSASHTYADDFSGLVAVEVTDGTFTTIAASSVVVNNVAPAGVTANASDSDINENDTITVSGSFTDPGSLDPHTVTISWGPGEGSTTINLLPGVFTYSANHQYLDDNPGGTAQDTYQVSVTVADEDSSALPVTVPIVVRNVPPSASAGGPYQSASGEPITLQGTFTDPGTQDSHTAVWDLDGDGAFGETGSAAQYGDETGFTPTYTGGNNLGASTITLRVTDDDGGVSHATATVVVETHFDFNQTTTLTEPGFKGVLPSDTYTSARGYGWNAAVSSRENSTPAGNLLLQDGHAVTRPGSGANPNGARTFNVDLPNGTYLVQVTMGDTAVAHDQMQVNAEGGVAELMNIATAKGSFLARSFPITVSGNQLNLEFSDLGGSNDWIVNALSVYSMDTVGTLTFTTPASMPADGTTIDEITISGAAPGSMVTVTSSRGTLATTQDQDANYAGIQRQAASDGKLTFFLQRPGDFGSTVLSADEINGGRIGSRTIQHGAPPHRYFDFGTGPVETGYLGATNAVIGGASPNHGWVGTPAASTQLGFAGNLQASTPDVNILRDMAMGPDVANSNPTTNARTFRAAGFTPNTQYYVVATIGDSVTRNSIEVRANGVTQAVGTLAGEWKHVTLTATSTASGTIDVSFRKTTTGGNWVVSGLTFHEKAVRDATPIVLTAAPVNPNLADPSIVDAYTGSGATPNNYVTVSATLGSITSSDTHLLYTGVQGATSSRIQVPTDGLGRFTFQYRRPPANGTAVIMVDEVDGTTFGSTTRVFGSPLLAAGPDPAVPDQAALTAGALAPIVTEAIGRWTATGLSAAQAAALANVQFQIVELGASGQLGNARPGVILIDDNAAGRGWFIDTTPRDDAEFPVRVAATERGATPASPAAGRIDLLTVVMHELGHELGFDDLDDAASPHSLLTESLGVGVRRLPASAAPSSLAPFTAPAAAREQVFASVGGAGLTSVAAPRVAPDDSKSQALASLLTTRSSRGSRTAPKIDLAESLWEQE